MSQTQKYFEANGTYGRGGFYAIGPAIDLDTFKKEYKCEGWGSLQYREVTEAYYNARLKEAHDRYNAAVAMGDNPDV